MNKLQRILMIVSLVVLVICLGATIWVVSITHDPSLWLYAAVFVLAIVWFGITIFKSRK